MRSCQGVHRRASRASTGGDTMRACGMMQGGFQKMSHTDWEVLLAWPSVTVRRRGRHLVADLLHPHHVLSTSARNGGWAEQVRHLVNHQELRGRRA